MLKKINPFKNVRLLDRYLFSEFIKTFIGTIIMLTGILVISLVMDNMKGFTASTSHPIHIFLYLLYSIPKLMMMVIAPSLMFAVCFVVGQFSANKELVSIMAAGISFYRTVAPLYILGVFIWFFVLFSNEFIVRPFNSKAANEFTMIQKGVGNKTDLVYQLHMRGKEGFYYLYWLDDTRDSVRGGFNYIKINSENLAEYVISAQAATYDRKEKTWKLEKIEEVYFDEAMNVKSYEKVIQRTYTFPEDIDYFKKPVKKVEEMNYWDLKDEIEVRRNKGIPYFDLEVERHAIFAVPLMNVIVVIIGSIAGAFTKRSAGVASLGITIGVVLLYYIMYSTGKSLGETGGVNPAISVWFTSIFFLTISFGLYKKFNL